MRRWRWPPRGRCSGTHRAQLGAPCALEHRPGATLISTSRNAADAAASASITPVSASPRTAGDADSATSTPELGHLRRGLGDLSRRLAGARRERARARSLVARLQHRRVGGQLLLGQPQCPRAKRARLLGRAGRAPPPAARCAPPSRPAPRRAQRRPRRRSRPPAPAWRRRPSRGTPPAAACSSSVHAARYRTARE